MPCYVPPDYDKEEREQLDHFTHNSPLAEKMCKLMKLIEQYDNCFDHTDFINKVNYIAGTWWEEHQKRDKKKQDELNAQIKKQRDIEAALSKLTPEERKLLKGKL